MKREIIDNKEFIVFNDGNIKVRFSTALNNVNYKKEDEEGKKNLEDLKEIFKVDKVVYVNQTHSSDFIDATFENFKGDRDCDSLVTTDKNTLIGVFTADCVPVIAYDKEKEVIAAIHSGWKGTFNSITKKTIEKMVSEFGSDSQDIKAYIGPHIRECCYEVSEELKDKFLEKTKIAENKLFKGRNLNMEVCIEQDLIESGVKEDNIYSLNLCTYCENKISLHSYRKSEGTYGRLFTFVYKK